jgi:RNA polymerase sigma factor (sigma-70 family)
MASATDRRAPRRTHVPPLRLQGDEQLARLIAAGDADAFATAYDRHLPALVRYCRAILLNAEDAEDAAQSAMLRALRALPERPPQVKLRAWLFRVAHNEAISQLRRRHAHESLDRAVAVACGDAAEAAATRARLRQLVADLRSLPERQRGALVMRELCGLGYGEIAGALGGSQGSAMQTVFEARVALTQFDEGRAMSCAMVKRSISGGDGRRLRGRRVRAHLRGCDDCRAFEHAVATRRRDLGLLAPMAGKGGLVALLGALGGDGSLRLAALAARTQLAPPGLRTAAVSALLVGAGGGIAADQLAHRGPARSAKPTHAHAVRIASVRLSRRDAAPAASARVRASTKRGAGGRRRTAERPRSQHGAGWDALKVVVSGQPAQPSEQPQIVPVAAPAPPATRISQPAPTQRASGPPPSATPMQSGTAASGAQTAGGGSAISQSQPSPGGTATASSPLQQSWSAAEQTMLALLQHYASTCVTAQIGSYTVSVGPGCAK